MTPRNPHRQSPSSTPNLSAQTGPEREMQVLERLKDVSCATEGVFMQELSRLAGFIQELPLQLAADQGYVLELKGGVLHIWGKKSGIENFELSSPDVRVLRVLHTSEGLLIEVKKGDLSLTVVLHCDRHPSATKAGRVKNAAGGDDLSARRSSGSTELQSRRTSPWRAPAQSSESCGGGRGGEG